MILPTIYPILDVDLCRLRGRDPRALAAGYADGGATLIQVRQKSPGSGPFLTFCRELLTTLAPRGVRLIINDRADLAAMTRAHGVHVGQDDLPVASVRRIVGSEMIIGLSTHTGAQVDAALERDIDYVAVGPIFGTATKDTGYGARGLELVRYAAGRGKPVVAIGGITLARAPEVRRAGAASVAVISDLMGEYEPAARVRAYLGRLG